MPRKRRHQHTRHEKSVFTKDDFHLNKHDEEKVLLFAAGILFGVGVSAAIVTSVFWFTSVALAVLGAVLFMIEYRQK